MKDTWAEEAKPKEDLSTGETSRDVGESPIRADSNDFKEKKDSLETGIIESHEAANPRLLGNVYEYTGRIKKFLGWESNPSLEGNSATDDADASDGGIESGCARESNFSEVNVTTPNDEHCLETHFGIEDLNLGTLFVEEDISKNENCCRENLESSFDDLHSKTADTHCLPFSIEKHPSNSESTEDIFNCDISGKSGIGLKVPMSDKAKEMNTGLLQEDKVCIQGIPLQDPNEILMEEIENEKKKSGINLSNNRNINSVDEISCKTHNEQQKEDEKNVQRAFENEVSRAEKPENFLMSSNIETKTNLDQALCGKELNHNISLARKLSLSVVNDVLSAAQNHVSEILDQKGSLEKNSMSHHTAFLSSSKKNSCDLMQTTADCETNTNGSQEKLQDDETKKEKNRNLNNDLNFKKENIVKTVDGRKIDNFSSSDFPDELDEDTICGIGSFKPKWIQPWATARTYLILYSIIGVLQGSYYSYLIGTMSTLEKRFAFKSKISGTIMMVDEITPLLLGVLIGYFGGKAHRPRMVAVGMLLSATCCFISALPYFIYGPGTHLTSLDVRNKTGPELCLSEETKDLCDVDDRPPTLAAVLFLLLGSFLKGFGNLAYYAIGLSYMDDNAEKSNTPMYFGVAFALRLLGPLVGFLMSSAFLKYYENPFDNPGFGLDDPRWIGGWWMGFVLQGVLLVIFTIPIILFPRRLPGHLPRKVEVQTEESLKTSCLGLFSALKRLAKNPLFIFLVLNTTMVIFGNFGHYIMLPKYMENQFHLTASDATLFAGPPALAAVMITTVLGGFLIWKYRPSAKMLTAGMVIIEILTAFGYLLIMIPQCQSVDMSNFGINEKGLILAGECNANCDCTTSAFTPVCGPDGKTTYFSPCFAGCKDTLQSALPYQKEQIFTNCSCMRDPTGQQTKTATEGICVVENCWSQALAYIIMLPTFSAIANIFRVAHTMILLRSINPEDKSVALGAFETLVSILGFTPYPIVFGALIDSACLVWEKSCGQTGNCWFYDVEKFNYLLHGASAFFCAMSAVCLVVIFFLSNRVLSLYDDDETDQCEKIETFKIDSVSSAVTKL